MAWTDYKYLCYPDRDGFTCSIPQIPIINLSFGSKSINTTGLVDSGCVITHADESIATILEIALDLYPEESTHGISGGVAGHMVPISMRVPGQGEPFESTVLFVKDLPVPVLLGQDNFFDMFNVKFEKRRGFFSIERVA